MKSLLIVDLSTKTISMYRNCLHILLDALSNERKLHPTESASEIPSDTFIA